MIIKNTNMDTPIIFTSSSDRDTSSRVTVTPKRLGISARVGQTVIVKINYEGKVFEVLFRCNRKKSKGSNLGSTLKTTSWPRELPQPEVGQINAVMLTVKEIEV